MLLAVILTLLPILVIFLLMTRAKAAADTSGVIGWILTLAIALLFFKTSLATGLLASLAGIISSFSVSLMVLTSILQITFMEATGAIKRIAVFVKTFASSDQAVQIMLINVGAGTLLVAVGATPVSILPPILVALGYSTFIAVLLPAIGFDALCTFALLGAPLVVYSDLTGVSLVESAQVFARFLPVISTVIGFGMLWIVGKWDLIRKGWIPCLIAGITNGGVAVAMAYLPWLTSETGVVLTGVIAGACTILVMLLYLTLRGKPIIDRSRLTEADVAVEKKMSLGVAMSPWIILVAALLIINFNPNLSNLLYTQLAMPLSVLPGQVIKTRMLWNAYTWVLISTVLAAVFLQPSARDIGETLVKWLRRAPRPVLSAAIFFAIAFVMNNSGAYSITPIEADKLVPNMIGVLALGSAQAFGQIYPFVSAYLGLFGGFVSGSEASAIAMFAKYHLLTSKMLGVDALIVTAATAIGAGLASVISPAKLQNAAATIDALGIESRAIRTALGVSVVMTLVAALLALLLALL